jgi:dual specificity tyrosine-phosphorylation-regulated kinase 2/3/4
MRPNFNTEQLHRNPSQAKPNGPRAPSFSITPKTDIAAASVEKQPESESAFSTLALRRKLSRKKSEPKVAEHPAPEEDLAKYDNMPPPKLPASASWTNTNNGNPSPQKPSYIRSRRQTSNSSIKLVPERQESIDSTMSTANSRPSLESVRTLMIHSNRSGSMSASTPNLLGARGLPQKQEAALDRDDMAAEDEMKKLAHKRKDFESAARQLDALQARAKPVKRISHETASRIFDLTIFERGEIVDYPDIYFTGALSARKIMGDLNSVSSNFGYDDDRGDYNIIEGDHLAYRYEVVDVLGKGSFGQVVRCVDHKTGILVAVKIIRNKKRFHQQALVEVNILQKLKEWVNATVLS